MRIGRLVTPRRADWLIALALLLWAADVPAWLNRGDGALAPGALGLGVVLAAPFLWRRMWPVLALTLSAGVFGLASARSNSDYLPYPLYSAAALGTLIAAYGIGAYGGSRARTAARWLGGVAIAVAVLIVASGARSSQSRSDALPFALLGVALILGEAQRARHEATRVAVGAAHLAERARIARELHDVLAHQLSGIVVQAGAARIAVSAAAIDTHSGRPASPAEDGEAGMQGRVLATIEQLARDALDELSHLLGVLRKDRADDQARMPAPTLADLDALLAGVRASGIPVELSVSGNVRGLPAGVELSAYRIVQEALTNVAKHAPAAATRVDLRYCPDGLRVQVVNAAPGRPGAARKARQPGGRGVEGMRERAELAGGNLSAARLRGEGFSVTAWLPSMTRADRPGP